MMKLIIHPTLISVLGENEANMRVKFTFMLESTKGMVMKIIIYLNDKID